MIATDTMRVIKCGGDELCGKFAKSFKKREGVWFLHSENETNMLHSLYCVSLVCVY